MSDDPNNKKTIEDDLKFIEGLDPDKLKYELTRDLGALDAKLMEKEDQPKVIPPQLKVRISDDRMEAYLNVIHPGKPRAIGFATLNAFLEQNRVVKGTILENLEKIVDLQVYDQEVLVARGKLPENGRDASIRIFSRETAAEKCVDVRGRVDFKSMRLKNMVQKGEVIAEKIPLTPGDPGYRVTGEELAPRPGRDMEFRKSLDVAVSPQNELQLIAMKTGMLFPNFTIRDLTIIEGNVDYSTGNITYPKSLIIKGDVKSGFNVESGENIEIQKCVEDALVIAGGDVIVKQGFLGIGKGLILGNNVVLGHIKQQKVVARGDITLGGEALYSQLQSGGTIRSMGVKSIVIGGSLIAEKAIEVGNVGNSQSVRTFLCVGYNKAIMDLDEQIRKLTDYLEKLDNTIKMFRAAGPFEKLPEEKKLLLSRLVKAQDNLTLELNGLRTSRQQIMLGLIERDAPYIKVTGTLFRNTTIQIGDQKKYITTEERNKMYIMHKGGIIDVAATSLRRGDLKEGK
jgi:uncharacterized protein